jgi:hypothetical protein
VDLLYQALEFTRLPILMDAAEPSGPHGPSALACGLFILLVNGYTEGRGLRARTIRHG